MTDFSTMPGHLARRFQQIAVAIFHAETEAAGFDLTPVQFAALSALAQNPGVDQATLAGLIAYDRTTMGGVIDRLEQKGMLRRETSPRDRRAFLLHLTTAGEDALAALRPVVRRAQAVMLRGLDDSEKAEFIRLFQKAIDAANDLSRAPLKAPELPEPTRRR
jgi:DNA-binding MarR family transcriptional regulator